MSPIIPNTLYYLLIKVKPTLFFQTESTKEMTMNRFRAKQKQKKNLYSSTAYIRTKVSLHWP